MCAATEIPAALPHGTVTQVPLSGPAAEAIDAAMLLEGITVDLRKAVLVRLQREAFWLSCVYPDNQAPVGFRGSS
jgi:hypothetical protein